MEGITQNQSKPLMFLKINQWRTMSFTYHGENRMSGIGAQVNVTVRSRNGLRPQTSDKAPIRGALRKDKIP